MAEEWKPVPLEGYCRLYQVSSLGRIKSLDRQVIEKTGLKRPHKGRLITPKKSGAYLGVSFFSEGVGKRFYIHRLVAMAFIPNPFNKQFVNHLNFDCHDNRAENLEWVTPKENTAWSATAGRLKPGEVLRGAECKRSKLTDELVRELRLTWRPGISMRALARQYEITPAAIYKILRGSSWRHVEPSVAVNWSR